MKRCVIISSSPKIEIPFLTGKIRPEDFIICADGGYKHAERAKISPDMIIGDFDSSEFPGNSAAEILRLPISKDDTDTFRCVKEALRRGFEEIVIFGGTGGRIDHSFANISLLSYIRSHGARGTLLDENNLLTLVSRGETLIKGKKGERFSIFPFGCQSCTLSLSGFEYELNRGVLRADSPIGISNVITEDCAYVCVYEGQALIIFSKE